jgi:hypothetical protein
MIRPVSRLELWAAATSWLIAHAVLHLAPSAPSASLRWLLLALHRGPVQWLRRITYGSSRP